MSDTELEKKLATYQELAKENPKVDVNLLMMNALKEESEKIKNKKSFRWPYLISIGIPPLGLIFAIKYYLSGNEEEKTAANVCVLLTVISVIIFFALAKVMFSGSGANLEQIEQIKPADVQGLYK